MLQRIWTDAKQKRSEHKVDPRHGSILYEIRIKKQTSNKALRVCKQVKEESLIKGDEEMFEIKAYIDSSQGG